MMTLTQVVEMSAAANHSLIQHKIIAVVSPESQFTQIDETTQYFQLVYTLVSLIDWVKLFKSN